MAKIPDAFKHEILGQKIDDNGALIESSDDVTAHFAFMFEVEGDENKTRVVFYNCVASRPKTEASTTNETKEPKTDTITLTISPRDTDKKVRASLEKNEKNKIIFEQFYKSVYEETKIPEVPDSI